MSYRLSHIGEAAVEQAAQPSTSMPMLAITGAALVSWVPVVGGAWAGKKFGGADGAWIGGISGLVVSVVALTSLLKKVQS